MDLLNTLVDKGLRRELPTREEALAVLATSDDDLLDVVAAAGKVRRHWFGRRVKLNYLVNLKSGLCPEDCSYCSQRLGSKAGILKYTWLKPDEASAGRGGRAGRAAPSGSAWWPAGAARRTGTWTGSPSTIKAIKDQNEGVEVCACLGLLSDGQAERLRAAGADAYNHNLNTSEATYGDITTTHTYADRVDTVQQAHAAGLSACSGPDRGHGRERRGPGRRRLLAARARPGLGAGQLPDPVRGHPAGQGVEPHPAALSAHPGDGPVRLPGRGGADRGRPRGPSAHACSRSPCNLANSIFLGDYLTSEGQAGQADLDMIADAGFEVEGADTGDAARAPARDRRLRSHGTGADRTGAVRSTRRRLRATCGDGCARRRGRRRRGRPRRPRPRTDLVAVRRRGAGTDLAPNA